MKPRNSLAFFLLGCLSLLSYAAPQVDAQSAFRPVDEPQTNEVASVLNQGLQLENQRRWGEALTHYEEAARRYPGDEQLARRMVIARLHFDISRRYVDESYIKGVRSMSELQSIELYGEVMTKIQTHYVHDPNWNELLRRGTDSLRIAMYDPEFAKVHGLEGRKEQIDPLLKYIEDILAERHVQDRRQSQDLVRWVGRLVAGRLPVTSSAVVLEYTCGATSALDAYSTFLTADQLDEVYSQIEGNFVGLGVELKSEPDALLIANVIPKGPAERAGIRTGERIVGVDGVSTKEASSERAADLLKGEQGTYVDVAIESEDKQVRRLRIRRERVEVPSVEDVRIIDPAAGVAYFRISSFQKTTSRDVDAALWKLHREGMRSLVIDVRGNPGGLLNEAVEVVDRFVTDGTIVATAGRSVRENYDYKAHRVGTWRVPLVVLIDEDSASASEIFAGAIRDHKRGTVVGHRSYGKGSVQGIFPLLAAKGGIRLTTAKFYSPNGRAISKGGVEPNVRVHTVNKPVTLAVGQQLDHESKDEVLAAGTREARALATRLQPTANASQQQSSARVDGRRVRQGSGISW